MSKLEKSMMDYEMRQEDLDNLYETSKPESRLKSFAKRAIMGLATTAIIAGATLAYNSNAYAGTSDNTTSKPAIEMKIDGDGNTGKSLEKIADSNVIPKWAQDLDAKDSVWSNACKDNSIDMDNGKGAEVKYTVKTGDSLSKIFMNSFAELGDEYKINSCQAYDMVKKQHETGDLLVNNAKAKSINMLFPGDIVTYKMPLLPETEKAPAPVGTSVSQIPPAPELTPEPVTTVITPEAAKQEVISKPTLENKVAEKETTSKKEGALWLYAADQADSTGIGIKLNNHHNEIGYDRDNLGDRLVENFTNAEKNMDNFGYGLAKLITGIFQIPGKVLNAVTWGAVPSYEFVLHPVEGEEGEHGIKLNRSKPEGGALSKALYPLGVIVGDAIGTPVNGALDAGKGLTFAALNVAQTIPDATIGNIYEARKGSDWIFNSVYLAVDLATNSVPFGDASDRVHAMDLDNGVKGLPIINNLYIDKHTVSAGGDEYLVHNTGVRKTVETIGVGVGNIVTGKWLSDLSKGSSYESVSRGMGGDQITSPGTQTQFYLGN